MNLTNRNFLLRWGWNDFFEKQIEEIKPDSSLIVGRVSGEERDRWRVQFNDDQNVWAELPGRYRYQAHSRMELPSVGDWVLCKYEGDQNVALVERVLKRKSCLYRGAVGGSGEAQILASNIDYAFILMSANIDFNIARLERYMSLVWESGAVPVILVTKAELAEDLDSLLEDLSSQIVGVDVHAISVQEKLNLQVLDKYLQPGKSVVFVGSSGVGKSTLTNYLLRSEVLETQEIRQGDDRGKHTTTARHLFFLESGVIVIDTPGMRMLPLMDQDHGLDTQFADLIALETQCRFKDCVHRTEPGCAVLGAFEDGSLDEDRWKRYQKLRRELQRKEINGDPVKQRLEREKIKKRNKLMYDHIKMKRR